MNTVGAIISAMRGMKNKHGVLATSMNKRSIYLTEYTFRREFPDVEATDGRYEKEINGVTFVAKEKTAQQNCTANEK